MTDLSDTSREVLEFIRERSPWSGLHDDIAERIGVSRSTASRAIRDLVVRRLIIMDGETRPKTYHIAPVQEETDGHWTNGGPIRVEYDEADGWSVAGEKSEHDVVNELMEAINNQSSDRSIYDLCVDVVSAFSLERELRDALDKATQRRADAIEALRREVQGMPDPHTPYHGEDAYGGQP